MMVLVFLICKHKLKSLITRLVQTISTEIETNMLVFVQPNEDGHRSELILVTTIVLILREILIFLEISS